MFVTLTYLILRTFPEGAQLFQAAEFSCNSGQEILLRVSNTWQYTISSGAGIGAERSSPSPPVTSSQYKKEKCK